MHLEEAWMDRYNESQRHDIAIGSKCLFWGSLGLGVSVRAGLTVRLSAAGTIVKIQVHHGHDMHSVATQESSGIHKQPQVRKSLNLLVKKYVTHSGQFSSPSLRCTSSQALGSTHPHKLHIALESNSNQAPTEDRI